jgi:glycine/D-amino acid oxidase-like deaminating enzyme/nitrite reductase/ring-hydroxylating ferredoxin subunit
MTDKVFWALEADDRRWPPLSGDVEADVAVVGAGIVGLAAAHVVARAGMSVTLLEARRVGHGATGRSTAKVTSQHGARYRSLVADIGEEGARHFARANEEALAWIAATVGDAGVLQRASAHVYADTPEVADELRQEAETAARLGLPATFVPELDLPVANHGAVRFAEQAQVNPCLMLRRLATGLPEGVALHEETRVVEVEHGEPCVLKTAAGRVRARWAVVATQLPVIAEGRFFAKAFPHAHPVIAARLGAGGAPDGMFISAGEPTRSFRRARYDGADYVVATGPTFRPGEGEAPGEAFAELEGWLAAHFDLDGERFRWTNEDFKPMDGLPFVGAASGDTPRLLVATGFDAWGITTGVVAARILGESIQGRQHPLAPLLDASRLRPLKGAATFVSENVQAGTRMVRDRVLGGRTDELDAIKPGEGGVVRVGGRPVAVSRAASGELTAVSATCTHLGCVVGWNPVDRTWDCPCHGSRFTASGDVVSGPTVSPLEAVDLASEAEAGSGQ